MRGGQDASDLGWPPRGVGHWRPYRSFHRWRPRRNANSCFNLEQLLCRVRRRQRRQRVSQYKIFVQTCCGPAWVWTSTRVLARGAQASLNHKCGNGTRGRREKCGLATGWLGWRCDTTGPRQGKHFPGAASEASCRTPRSNENRCDSINPLTAAHHTWGSVNDSRGEAQAAE